MSFLLEYLIESSLAAGLVWLGYKFVLEDLTFFSWNRIYLLFGLVLSLCLPLLSIPVTWLESLPTQTLISFGTDFSKNLSTNTVSSPSSSVWGLSRIVIVIWLLPSIVLFARLVFSVITLFRKIQRADKIKLNGLTIALDSFFTPSSFFGYVLLPKEILKSPGLEQIVKHESSHLRLGHSIDLMLVQVLKSIYWFNPFLYLFEKSLKEVHEYQADSEVIKTFEPISYSRLLVDSISISKNNFIPSFNQFQTKKRIVMMNKPKSNAGERMKFLLSLPVVLVMLLLFSCQINNDKNKLLGVWTGSDFVVELPDNSDFAALVEGGKNLHIDGKMILNDDNTYQIQDPSSTVNGKGVWELDGEVLRTTDELDNVAEYKILKLDESTLVTEHSFNMETPMGVVAGNIMLTYKR